MPRLEGAPPLDLASQVSVQQSAPRLPASSLFLAGWLAGWAGCTLLCFTLFMGTHGRALAARRRPPRPPPAPRPPTRHPRPPRPRARRAWRRRSGLYWSLLLGCCRWSACAPPTCWPRCDPARAGVVFLAGWARLRCLQGACSAAAAADGAAQGIGLPAACLRAGTAPPPSQPTHTQMQAPPHPPPTPPPHLQTHSCWSSGTPPAWNYISKCTAHQRRLPPPSSWPPPARRWRRRRLCHRCVGVGWVPPPLAQTHTHPTHPPHAGQGCS